MFNRNGSLRFAFVAIAAVGVLGTAFLVKTAAQAPPGAGRAGGLYPTYEADDDTAGFVPIFDG